MALNKADLIIHPARLQILQALASRPMSTAGLAELLSGLPKSSIYRHIRALLEGGMIEVAETRPVKGTLEKFYRLAQPLHLSQADLSGFTREDHLRYFAMFLASQLQAFSDYLAASPQYNFQDDRTGYSEAGFYATPQELDEVLIALNQRIMQAAANPAAETRHRHKIAIITHPFLPGDPDHE
jgi:DNA-binding transcriptional ArsR family regulator